MKCTLSCRKGEFSRNETFINRVIWFCCCHYNIIIMRLIIIEAGFVHMYTLMLVVPVLHIAGFKQTFLSVCPSVCGSVHSNKNT